METAINNLNEALSIIHDYETGYPMASESVAYVATGGITKVRELITKAINTMEGGN